MFTFESLFLFLFCNSIRWSPAEIPARLRDLLASKCSIFDVARTSWFVRCDRKFANWKSDARAGALEIVKLWLNNLLTSTTSSAALNSREREREKVSKTGCELLRNSKAKNNKKQLAAYFLTLDRMARSRLREEKNWNRKFCASARLLVGFSTARHHLLAPAWIIAILMFTISSSRENNFHGNLMSSGKRASSCLMAELCCVFASSSWAINVKSYGIMTLHCFKFFFYLCLFNFFFTSLLLHDEAPSCVSQLELPDIYLQA